MYIVIIIILYTRHVLHVPESGHIHKVVKLRGLLTIVGMGHGKLVTSTREVRLVHIKIYVLHAID